MYLVPLSGSETKGEPFHEKFERRDMLKSEDEACAQFMCKDFCFYRHEDSLKYELVIKSDSYTPCIVYLVIHVYG